MTTSFIITLLQQVEKFEKSATTKSNPDIDGFRNWLNEEKYYSESPTKLFAENDQQVSFLENEICKQILLISRYARISVRKGLTDFPELANEEFTYLYRIKDEPGISKMALIEKNAHEKPTGIQIIRRLLDYGLISEEQSGSDKRSKILNLTKSGEKYFGQCVPVVNGISKTLSGDLNDSEKNTLLNLLKKLNLFHKTRLKEVL